MDTNFCSAFLSIRKAKRVLLVSFDLMISTATWSPRVASPCSFRIARLRSSLGFYMLAEFLRGLVCPKLLFDPTS